MHKAFVVLIVPMRHEKYKLVNKPIIWLHL